MKALNSLRSVHLKPCALAFEQNLNRTVVFSMLPSSFAFYLTRNLVFKMNALIKGRSTSRPFTIMEVLQTDLTPEMQMHWQEQYDELSRMPEDELVNFKMQIGVASTNRFAEDYSAVRLSLDALMTSVVLECWLSFEALASDLWVAGVDNGTKSISNRVHIYDGWNKPDESVNVARIAALESDAKTSPGSFYREVGKVSFSKLRDIKKFFAAAFGDDMKKLFDTVENGRIGALSAIRNCIMHSAGRVDGGFQRAVQAFPDLKILKPKDQLPLDGNLVNGLRETTAQMGAALLKHLDEVLMAGV